MDVYTFVSTLVGDAIIVLGLFLSHWRAMAATAKNAEKIDKVHGIISNRRAITVDDLSLLRQIVRMPMGQEREDLLLQFVEGIVSPTRESESK